jgi:Xaa-Pro aminopeptidase
MGDIESARAANLQEAQEKAASLFEEIERNLIRPGVTESALSKEIHELGAKRFNVRTHWHKRVVRSGPNTLQPYAENPPDRTILTDDILFIDLGPVFEEWEADFGRTFVLGEDATKKQLRDDLDLVWRAGKSYFNENPNITGQDLYRYACQQAHAHGWEFGGPHAGHLVGTFPHERIPNDKITFYITEGNENTMRSLDKEGHERHWILETHLVDRERQIGGFCEQLLTVG